MKMNKLMGLLAVGMFGLGTSVAFAEDAAATAANPNPPEQKEAREKGGERRGGPKDIDDLFNSGDRGPAREMGRPGRDDQAGGQAPGREMGRPGPGGDQRMMVGRLLQKYPKEMEEIKQLRETDPEAARDKMQELSKKASEEMKAEREKMQAERKKFMEMVKAYQKDKDPKALEQIKAKVTELYTQRLEDMKKRIEMDENNIKARKAKYEEAVSGKDQEITKRLERITNPPKIN
jgi:hypothetical protein